MALGIEITRTTPLFPRGTFVQWDLLNPTESGLYLFDIYRSGSSAGPWTLLDQIFGTTCYVDSLPAVTGSDPNQLSLARGIFYRVVVTSPASVVAEVISAVEPTLDPRQRLLKRKFLRDETILLQRLNGVPVAVLKRLHWGTRCTKCFDKYNKEVVRGACTTCYGTGFVTGYYTPIVTWARRNARQVNTSITVEGKTDVVENQVTLLDVPKVEKDDVLVFLRDNQRYIVTQKLQTELQTVAVHQKLLVSELARSDISYRILVDPTRSPPLF